MKKVFFVAVIAIFSLASVNAQTSFGLKGGVNSATLKGDIDGNKSLIGFNAGLFAEIAMADSFYIQPELYYSTQGTEDYRYLSNNLQVVDKLNLDYINLPIMFKYDVANRFYLEAGPQVGFLVSAKRGDVDVKDIFEKTDFGANFGVSYGFTDAIFAQARYNVGLSDIYKNEGNNKVTNSVMSFSLGYKF